MKRLLFILVLISAVLFACGQTQYVDLPEITTVAGTDGYTMYRGGSAYKMTHSTLVAKINDTLSVYRDSLDSYWLLIQNNLSADDSASITYTTDTITEYTAGAGVTIEGMTVEDDSLKWSLAGIYHSGGYIYLYSGSTLIYKFTEDEFAPTTTNVTDLGDPDANLYFDNLYHNKSYFEDVNAYIEVDGFGNLTFDDGNNSATTLTDLIDWVDTAAVFRPLIDANTAKVTNATHTGDVTGSAGLTIASGAVDIAMLSATGTPSSSTYLRGDNTWATPGGDSLAHLLVDTMQFVFGYGIGLPGDTICAFDGAILGAFFNDQDTLLSKYVRDNWIGSGTGSGFVYDIVADPIYRDATPAYTIASNQTISNDGGESGGNLDIEVPPNHYIWCEIDGTPTTKPTNLIIIFEFAKSRHE